MLVQKMNKTLVTRTRASKTPLEAQFCVDQRK